MIAKIVIIVPTYERLIELSEKHSFDGGIWASGMEDGRIIAACYPKHHSTRFDLDRETDVIVLPSAHDPDPVGDVHQHLAHVGAKPHESMRAIMNRLHKKHGPAFHADT